MPLSPLLGRSKVRRTPERRTTMNDGISCPGVRTSAEFQRDQLRIALGCLAIRQYPDGTGCWCPVDAPDDCSGVGSSELAHTADCRIARRAMACLSAQSGGKANSSEAPRTP